MKLSDRLRHYAKEALDNAATARNGEVKRIYLENAAAWMRLAETHDDPPVGDISDPFENMATVDVAA